MAFLDFLKEVGPKRNATHMGVSFLFVFMAFSVSQNFQTSSDHKKQGANALGILYGCFTFFNFACSFVVQKLGPKVCLFGGACTYALFVAANIHYVREAACNSARKSTPHQSSPTQPKSVGRSLAVISLGSLHVHGR
jgi:hypothetical protein